MPELPEAETLARDLSRTIVGKRIVKVGFKEPKGLNLPPDGFARKVKGRVEGAGRRAKAVVLYLEEGDTLWLHMGLRSVVGYVPREQLPPNPFLSLIFDDNSAFFMDKTFMGYAHFVSRDELPRRWAEYGVEPLDEVFTPDKLNEILVARPGQAVKSILMDQQTIAGIGNIFSDEILHAAGLHPARKVATLSGEEVKRLYNAIRDVLRKAVEAGGGPEWPSLSGKESSYVATVHGQTFCGEHNSPVKKVSLGGRTSYVCEQGQQ